MPRILVNCSLNSDESSTATQIAYCDPVTAAGGLPLIAPAFTAEAQAREALSLVQGLLLIGGPDYLPESYGGHPQPPEQLMSRRRHDADLLLVRLARERRLPILGICGGLQALVIGCGGALVQDIPSEWPQAIVHQKASHAVAITGRLAVVLGQALTVNSFHHQAALPDRTGGLDICATAPDGVIEAVSAPDHPFQIGVQWHPERLGETAASQALFAAFVAAAAGAALHAG